jgi:acyl-CoA synthetase (AMP-forming)/AMP-acid ligase II
MPEQLEDEIRRYADFEFYVVGAPDEKWGERIELVAECTEAELAALMANLRAKLSHKYMPKAARAIVKLPRTANGKVKRLTIANLDMRE